MMRLRHRGCSAVMLLRRVAGVCDRSGAAAGGSGAAGALPGADPRAALPEVPGRNRGRHAGDVRASTSAARCARWCRPARATTRSASTWSIAMAKSSCCGRAGPQANAWLWLAPGIFLLGGAGRRLAHPAPAARAAGHRRPPKLTTSRGVHERLHRSCRAADPGGAGARCSGRCCGAAMRQPASWPLAGVLAVLLGRWRGALYPVWSNWNWSEPEACRRFAGGHGRPAGASPREAAGRPRRAGCCWASPMPSSNSSRCRRVPTSVRTAWPKGRKRRCADGLGDALVNGRA